MKKVLLATTCAAALSVFAWTTSGVSFAQQSTGGGGAQQNQNMGGASDQQNERKAAPSAQQTRPGGAMSGATNENREQRTNSAEQRENTQPGKAEGNMERHAPTTAEGKQPTEKGGMQSGQANERERMHNGAANANETKPGMERSRTGENAQERPNEGRAAAEQQNGRATGANETGRREMGQMRLDPKQATEFRSRLEKHGDIARASVDFDARVGVVAPESIRLEPLPADIVAEYPEFRGYDVTIVRDDVVIVDPHTRQVVEVIRQGGTNAAEAAPGPRRERLRLTREQDEVIRRNVHIEHPAEVEFDERMDERVPDTVTLAPMPPPVVADIPEVRSYDYFVDRSDHVVIVDPETHEVVGVVEQ